MTKVTNANHPLALRCVAPIAFVLCAAPLGACGGDAGGAGGGPAPLSSTTQYLGLLDERSHESRPAAESGAQWWQWVLSLPGPVNPTLDTTGEDCMLGQHGSVFYLAGFLLGGSVTRSCSIPEGVDLFFPIANSTQNNTPGLCGQPANVSFTVPQMRQIVTGIVDGFKNLSADFDGKPIKDVRRIGTHPLFPIDQPANNVFTFLGFTPCPAGVIATNVQDGVYATVHELEPGPHTVHIHADNPDGTVFQDVTYNLTVVRVDNDD
jgi:hypothetical protein